ncbi:hypothetical protein PG993_005752 [Apiospora rasikravindrae]|uniref:Uncharacterized protein n=1 Tax=Apiospora rasikravindrae TaxID=990691 RepID=A0ABR1T9P3_9PEZI
MKVVALIAPFLAAVAAAMPANIDSDLSGRDMAQYCSAINMGGACTTINESVKGNCELTAHEVRSIKVFDGYACGLSIRAYPRSGGCGQPGLKNYKPGTYDDVDEDWINSRAISCHTF